MKEPMHISSALAVSYAKDMTIPANEFLMFVWMLKTGDIIVDD